MEKTSPDIWSEERTLTTTEAINPLPSKGIEISNLNRYVFISLVIISCFLILLWSRLNLGETKVALGHAQTRYENALKERQRLELELHLLLSPGAIEQQVADWNLDPHVPVIDIFEAPNK